MVELLHAGLVMGGLAVPMPSRLPFPVHCLREYSRGAILQTDCSNFVNEVMTR